MKLNMTFSLTVETRRYRVDDKDDPGENVDLELTMNTLEASMFLLKVCKNVFIHQDYKVLLSTNQVTGEVTGISFRSPDDFVYVVRSKEKFYGEVLTGYEKIRLLEKMSSIAEFAEFQSSAPSEDEILDEFDDNVNV